MGKACLAAPFGRRPDQITGGLHGALNDHTHGSVLHLLEGTVHSPGFDPRMRHRESLYFGPSMAHIGGMILARSAQAEVEQVMRLRAERGVS
jgi:hypothetical protein